MNITDIDTLSSQFSKLELVASNKKKFIINVPKSALDVETTLFFQAVEKEVETYVSIENIGIFTILQIKTLSQYDVQHLTSSLLFQNIAKAAIKVPTIASKMTPAHFAALINSVELLEKQSDIDSSSCSGMTPLQIASKLGHLQVVEKLIKLGAKVNIFTPHGTAISVAASSNQKVVTEFLATSGADITSSKNFSIKQSEYLTGKIASLPPEELGPVIFSIKHRRLAHFQKRYKNLIAKNPQGALLQEYYKQETVRRAVSHVWRADWDIKISDTLKVPQKITYQNGTKSYLFTPMPGGYVPFFYHKMQKYTKTFLKNAPVDEKILHLLHETLIITASQPTGSERFFLRYKAGLPVIVPIHISEPSHAVSILFWQKHIIICNRGNLSNKPVEIFHINSKNVHLGIFCALTTPFKNGFEYKYYLFTMLATELFFRKAQMEDHLENLLWQPYQVMGNCSWESAETSVNAFLLLAKIKERKLLHPSVYSEEDVEQLAIETGTLFRNWLMHHRLIFLEKYLKLLQKKNNTFHSSYEPLSAIQKQLRIEEKKDLFPANRKEIDRLRKTYPML